MKYEVKFTSQFKKELKIAEKDLLKSFIDSSSLGNTEKDKLKHFVDSECFLTEEEKENLIDIIDSSSLDDTAKEKLKLFAAHRAAEKRVLRRRLDF